MWKCLAEVTVQFIFRFLDFYSEDGKLSDIVVTLLQLPKILRWRPGLSWRNSSTVGQQKPKVVKIIMNILCLIF